MSMEGFVSDFFPFLLTKLYFVQNKLLNVIVCSSGGELLELRLLDTRLLDTFGRKSIARHKF
jgi:hypothetical protein